MWSSTTFWPRWACSKAPRTTTRCSRATSIAMHQRTIARFSAGNPYAFIVPPRQRDPGAAAELMRLLEAGGAEIATARAAIVADGQTYEAGSTVVPLAQPFGRWIKDLLESQTYPDVRPAPGASPERPYDVTAWTLGMLLGVDVRQINRPFEVPSSRSSASSRVPASTIIGGGVNAVIAREANADLIVINRLLGADAHLSWTPSAIRLAGRDWPAGTVFAKDLPRTDPRTGHAPAPRDRRNHRRLAGVDTRADATAACGHRRALGRPHRRGLDAMGLRPPRSALHATSASRNA